MNKEESDLKTELEEAFIGAGINDYSINDAQSLMAKIKGKFISGEPRAWWLSLKHDVNILSYDNNAGYKDIPDVVKKNFTHRDFARVILIVDEDNENKFLFKIPLNSLPCIIEACRYFEYYVVAEDLSWLIAENDHGDLLICSS